MQETSLRYAPLYLLRLLTLRHGPEGRLQPCYVYFSPKIILAMCA